MKKSVSLAINDMKNITRDFISIMMLIIPVMIGLLLRFLPYGIRIFKNITFPIADYYPFIIGFFIIFPSTLYGIIIGFRILDERDENLIAYFSITPLSKKGYIIYRIFSPMIICFIFTFFVIYIPNLIDITIIKTLPAIFLASLQTPIIALFMGSFAGNKLEGMAAGKMFSIVNFTPVAVLFESKLKYLAGITPQFWVTEIFIKGYENQNIFIPFIADLFITIVWLGVLFKIFEKRIR